MKLSMPEMPPATLLAALGSYNLLPVIVFLPTRRRCDKAASEAAVARRDLADQRREARRDFMRVFVTDHPEVRGHRHWDTIVRGGVASHHAGHLPAWKLVIEKLMSAGLLDAIFATSTVAAGVDFPARTVVLTGADVRTGRGWRPLSASELQQMTGRAGRRSRDNVGFIVAAPGLHQDPGTIADLLRAAPDPLVSQFRATYTTLLNLLDAFGSFSQVREIAERSFAHRGVAGQIAHWENEAARCTAVINERLSNSGSEMSVPAALGLERLVSARARLQESRPQTRAEVMYRWLDRNAQPGRVVGIGRSGRRLVMITERRDDSVRGIREDGRGASLPLTRIGRVYAPIYRLREDAIQDAFEEVQRRGRDLVLTEPRLRDANDHETETVKIFDDLIESAVPSETLDEDRQRYVRTLWSVMAEAQVVNRANRQIESLREEVWRPFEQRARVLASFGYIDFESERVNERGRWLADLHIDRPLLVGEALESGLFQSLDFAQLASVIAALTADEDRDYGELELADSLVTCLARFEDIGFRVSTEEWKYGVDPAPELNFSAAGAAASWATGSDWPTLAHETRAEEGDLFRMLSRTGEALLQIAGLKKAHPEAARLASIAADAVLREPVR
jgi:superfamily II RNA helicase